MSQSPNELTKEAIDPYVSGWRQLFRLVRRGSTLSGFERNCAFLNTGTGRFANVSAVTGFDFLDDGRALAVVDWDQDGDLDIWVSNRTGPQVRLRVSATGIVARTPRDRSKLAVEERVPSIPMMQEVPVRESTEEKPFQISGSVFPPPVKPFPGLGTS